MQVILALIIIIVFNLSAFASSSPEFEKLWDIPFTTVEYEISDSYQEGSIQVNEIYYQSREYQGEASRIFGYYCYPINAKQELPAILLSHGGGGTAVLSRTINWARRGYAVLTIDLPGNGEGREGSRSTGPNMDVPVLLRTKPNPDENYLVHAVAAARNGITFLTQQEEVDSNRIGMVGLSWGGVLTLLVNGQDERLATAVNVFGAGYIPEGCTWQDRFDVMSKAELEQWNTLIDPKNFLLTQHAPILFITGTNDHCYYLPTFQKSYEQVTVPKKLYLVPNLRHRFMADTQQVVWTWLDNELKNKGTFPEITFLSLFRKGEDKVIVSAAAEANTAITRATLHYAVGGPSRWTKQVWESKSAYFEDDTYYFSIPAELIEPEILFYVNVEDSRGAITSTPIRSIFKVNMMKDKESFAVSSPIQKINIHEPPLKFLGFKEPPEFLRIFFSKDQRTYHMIEANLE
ncbi:alpha/beta hydrolase family protein [Candidatus Margulisiibacteriota bacterium]